MEPQSATVASDLVPSASPLKLVKLRLSLALVAMAIVPLAIAAPLAYSILDGQRNAERLRAELDSTALASAIGTRLDRTQQAVARTAASAIVSGFFVTPQKTTTATARAALLTLGTSTEDGVRDVMLQDADGNVRIWITGGKVATGQPKLPPDDAVLAATLALDGPDSYASSVHSDVAGAPTITISAPIPSAGGDSVTGIVRVEVSLAQVLGSSATGVIGGSVLAQLMSQSGTTLSQARGTGAVTPADGTVATAAVVGFPDWRVQVTEPHLLDGATGDPACRSDGGITQTPA